MRKGGGGGVLQSWRGGGGRSGLNRRRTFLYPRWLTTEPPAPPIRRLKRQLLAVAGRMASSKRRSPDRQPVSIKRPVGDEPTAVGDPQDIQGQTMADPP